MPSAPNADVRPVLVVTNDFPPRAGGIQTFVEQVLIRQPAGSVIVYASDHRGSAGYDEHFPFPVYRDRTRMLLPTPRVRRRVLELLAEHDPAAVWFGAAAPLGLLATSIRRAAPRVRLVATTHGHEAGWARIPGARQLLRRIARSCDTTTYLGAYTKQALRRACGPVDLRRLAPGVDPAVFTPNPAARTEVRTRHGLGDRPVVVCVSRLVPRKGQDALIEALPSVAAAIPDVALLIVGAGRYGDRLRRLARELGVADRVVFTGAVPTDELPAHYAAGDVFAMPCRTRRGGLDVEGLGIVFLEASACGLPVLVGASGGAPDAVRDGATGYVVDGRDQRAISARLTELLGDEAMRARLGAAGRAWVEQEWTWDRAALQWAAILRD